MDAGVLSTVAALAGTAIGALFSLGATWIATTSQARAARLKAEREKKEELYGRFMDQLARLDAGALTRVGVDCGLMTDAYALNGRIALHATEPVADAAMAALR